MKASCCRSAPRCATCPVVLAARARGRFVRDAQTALVEEILLGASPRALPTCVTEALAACERQAPERQRLLH